MQIDYTGIAAIIGALILIYKAVILTPREVDSSEAGIVKQYEEAQKMSLERANALNGRVDILEGQVKTLNKDLEERDKILKKVQDDLAEMAAWAERLSHQVISLGGVPVKLKINKRRKGET
jgi:cell division septation protein DedD